jgi:hypothetical protein
MVGVSVGSGVGVSAMVGVSEGVWAVWVEETVGLDPQADSTTDRNKSTTKNFFIEDILLKGWYTVTF